MLKLSNIHVQIDNKPIVDGVSLVVGPGEVHAIMGPNGSGKSTLAKAISGHPDYKVLEGSQAILDGQNILDLSPDERAQLGLFLAFQYPVEVPGVRVERFLRLAHQARFADNPEKIISKALDFRNHLHSLAEELRVKPELLRRGLNEGFSGGEKKRLEILQMAVLEPRFAVLDETDSGLDIDAIKAVAEGVKQIAQKHNTGILIITHYQRILEYLTPDKVHVMVAGEIVESGDVSLVTQLEATGYQKWEG